MAPETMLAAVDDDDGDDDGDDDNDGTCLTYL